MIEIDKAQKLKGVVRISGSKNSSMPIICTSLLNKGVVQLKNVPKISDIFKLLKILLYLNCKISWKRNLIIDSTNVSYKPLLLNECKEIRGSYYLIPVMLYLFNKCEIILPGGCDIGIRGIDEHIRGFEALGYKCNINNNLLTIEGEASFDDFLYKMSKDSVGASINIIIASLKCKYAKIDNLVIEPEGLDVINFLNCLGFNIKYLNRICVIKEKIMQNMNVIYTIIPDRIEAMTFVVMGLLCGNIKIKGAFIDHIRYPLDLLIKNGYRVKIKNNNIVVNKSRGSCFNIRTDIYPLFPTDLQPIFGVLLSFGRGSCVIEENIFDNRMQIYNDLNSCGGYVNIINNKAYLIGCDKMDFINAKCIDLRQAAALMILGLKCGGRIENIELINRGYECFFKKISKLKAKFHKN